MKKIILLSMLVGAFCLVAQPTMAGMYREPDYPYDYGYKAGNCIMVTERSEADSTHVYTLNPDNTVKINSEYWERWSRNARCDEIQFHVDHNTPISVLSAWLDEVEIDRYRNLATSRYNGNTISTSRQEWYLIRDGVAHRIYDWLTAKSWGLLRVDRLSIPHRYTGNFYSEVTIGNPLDFNDGPYADKMRAIWKDEDRNYNSLPLRLAEDIELHVSGNPKIFVKCRYIGFSSTDRGSGNLLDWDWMLHNPGCPFAE